MSVSRLEVGFLSLVRAPAPSGRDITTPRLRLRMPPEPLAQPALDVGRRPVLPRLEILASTSCLSPYDRTVRNLLLTGLQGMSLRVHKHEW